MWSEKRGVITLATRTKRWNEKKCEKAPTIGGGRRDLSTKPSGGGVHTRLLRHVNHEEGRKKKKKPTPIRHGDDLLSSDDAAPSFVFGGALQQGSGAALSRSRVASLEVNENKFSSLQRGSSSFTFSLFFFSSKERDYRWAKISDTRVWLVHEWSRICGKISSVQVNFRSRR